jgi:phosphoglycerate kinase
MSRSEYFENRMTIEDVALGGKKVLVRVDFNVPLSKDGEIEDDFRIRAALPTIEYVLDQGGRPILISHMGRPKGKRVDGLSLAPVRAGLEGLLGRKVHLAPDCVGDEVEEMAVSLGPGEVLLLENCRFHPEETENEPGFAAKLAALADVYVNDAFGTAHRAHASTEGVAHLLRPALAGLLMKKELGFLGKLLAGPRRPYVAIIGGAKISGKIEVLKNLMDRVDAILVGGGIANTFLKTEGVEIGDSLYEETALDVAGEIIDLAETKGIAFVLPDDFAVADEVRPGTRIRLAMRDEGAAGGCIADIGDKTLVRFIEHIARAETIFWNGPMGVFEIEDFSRGTLELAQSVAAASQGGAFVVVGGGDTASAVAKANVKDKITHVSTGGGASLEFVEGKELPGIVALSMKGEVQH